MLALDTAATALELEDVQGGRVVEEELGVLHLARGPLQMLPIAFPSEIVSATIEEATQKMTIVFEGAISAQGSMDLLITHKAFLSSTKTIAELKADYPSEVAELGQVENKAALSINMKDAIKRELKKKNMKLKFSLTSEMNLQGEIMNSKKPETTKLYEGTFVQLK